MIDKTLSKASRWGRRNTNSLFCVLTLLFALLAIKSGNVLMGIVWLTLAFLLYYPIIRAAFIKLYARISKPFKYRARDGDTTETEDIENSDWPTMFSPEL